MRESVTMKAKWTNVAFLMVLVAGVLLLVSGCIHADMGNLR